MKQSEFIHLHVHTQYSLLDGAIRFSDLFALAKAYKMPSVAITDHGNLFGAIEFYQKALQNGIKPIIGCETYIAPESRLDKTSRGIDSTSYHLVLLVKNLQGYKNLLKMVTSSYLEGFYYKPRIDMELLRKHNEGLIALSACLHGQIPYLINHGNKEGAKSIARELKNIFDGGRFYLEIQENNIPEQKVVNEELIALAKELSLPLVATNDCHYLKKEDVKAHDVLLCIQTGKTVDDQDRMKFSTDQLYFKSPAEMTAAFSYCPEAIKNTVKIAQACNLELTFDEYHFPNFPIPKDETLDSILEREARAGLEEKLDYMKENDKNFYQREKKYRERLDEEIEVIKKMGFSGYFLIVADFINHARKIKVPVGPGRGSAAGSLVAYSLKITDLDPIPYNLIFERFLNPERISMPDIDIDFCIEGRDKIIKYVLEKYGKNQVAQIITFGKMQAKGVIRDVGRALGMSYGSVDKIAKLVPSTLNITLKEAIKQEPAFKESEAKDPKVKELIGIAMSLEGLVRHASTHAAGVVISDREISEYLPLYKGQKDEVTTQFDMKAIEKIGLIKFDLLGLKTLTVIDKAVKLINSGKDKNFSLDDIDLGDKKSYQLLSDGNTAGIFQLESSGMRDILIKLKPETFEDLIAVIALYRPGPLGSGMVDDFIKRKHGKTEVSYELPQLKGILNDTYGIIVYQEQVMKTASELADFSLGDADILRRAMGKKIPQEMTKQKDKFLDGAKKNNIDLKKAEKVFDLMAKFAEYGFNKSHSAAYAKISFQTAYLKSHFSIYFMAALLTSEADNTDKVIRHITECHEQQIDVLPPDINESHQDFTVVDGKIRFGLKAVKNVGTGAIDSIISSREKEGFFSSIFDFCEKNDLRRVNKRVLESLIKCGAFDSTGLFRSQLMTMMEEAVESAHNHRKANLSGQLSMFGHLSSFTAKKGHIAPNIPEWQESQRLSFEKEVLGFYLTGHPLSKFQEEIDEYTNSNLLAAGREKYKKQVRIAGIVTSIKEIIDRKGGRMAFVALEDLKGSIEAIVYSKIYKETSSLLKADQPLLISGDLSVGEESVKLIANDIIPLSEAREKLTATIHFNLRVSYITSQDLDKLKNLLLKHQGNHRSFFHLIIPEKSETVISLGNDFKLSPSTKLREEVNEFFGDKVVNFDK